MGVKKSVYRGKKREAVTKLNSVIITYKTTQAHLKGDSRGHIMEPEQALNTISATMNAGDVIRYVVEYDQGRARREPLTHDELVKMLEVRLMERIQHVMNTVPGPVHSDRKN